MIEKKMSFKKYLAVAMILCTSLSYMSCSDDNDDTPKSTVYDKKGEFLIAVKGASAEYIMQAKSLDGGADLPISSNVLQLPMTDYLWSFNKGVAVGLVYQQGSPGIGYGFRLKSDSTLHQIAQFIVSTRFTSYGFFNNYFVTSVGGQTPVDDNGNAIKDENGTNRVDGATFVLRSADNFSIQKQKTILTKDLTSNGNLVTFSGVVDLGNNQFLTGMIQSEYQQTSSDNGGSSTGRITYPDSIRVAVIDGNLNVVRTFGDNRISYSSGRYRSQYYSQIGKTDDGTVYVFSGAFGGENSSTKLPCGALKVNASLDGFDKNYYFNIQAQTGGYKFKRLWYIDGHRFLLEIYNDKAVTLASEATQYGIVDMSTKTFNWIGGLPDKSTISYMGIPMIYQGSIYLPITVLNENAAIFKVKPRETQAIKSLSIIGASQIRAIGHLTVN